MTTSRIGKLAKLWRPDERHSTRFHTERGRLCIQPVDAAYALATTVRRRLTGVLPTRPWLVLGAVRVLKRLVPGASVFEYSMGMSTVWYAGHAARVFAVEHDRAWHARIEAALRGRPNVTTYLAPADEAYEKAIERCGVAHFDIISVDGIRRLECVRKAIEFLSPRGALVVDNTDRPELRPVSLFLEQRFRPDEIRVFSGYSPGTFHATETTVAVRNL